MSAQLGVIDDPSATESYETRADDDDDNDIQSRRGELEHTAEGGHGEPHTAEEAATTTVSGDDDEQTNGASPTSTTTPTLFRRTRSLRINTTAPDPTSETSSIVPTSARLSIASTTYPFAHRSLNQNLNGHAVASTTHEAIPTLLDDILRNPGWSAAVQSSEAHRQRRNSLYSMRSLAPTLPPYEEYRDHVLVPSTEAGPSLPRNQNAVASANRGEKAQAQSLRVTAGETDSLAGEPHHGLEHGGEGEEGALIAHYSSVVRTIDSRYTAEVSRLAQEKQKAVEEFEREVARMRNEIDATYRGVLKERDKAVERAREEAASRVEELEKVVRDWKAAGEVRLETIAEMAREREEQSRAASEREVQRARHEVEDVWERRWRDRMALVDEELGRRVRERDGEWLAFLKRENPDLLRAAEDFMLASEI